MRWSRKLFVPLIFALLLVAYNIFQNMLATEGWDRVKNDPFVKQWGVWILAGIVIVLAAILVLWEARRERSPAEESGDHPLRLRQRLIDHVLEFAQAQFDGGLYAKARQEFDLAERPLRVTTEDLALDVTIEPFYRSLPGPLVILGEPGTGKTTLRHELATVLCTANESDPIPVPFSLAHWALKEEPLAQWMVSELRRNYGIGSALAKSWVSKEVVVPFLDGLDEVPAAKRAACVNSINEYRAAHPAVRFVLTCREVEYKELKAAIHVDSAVVVRTLSRDDVDRYLQRNAPKFDGLRQALGVEPALWELMDTPLMLWVGAFALEHGSGLGPTDTTLLKERLFDRYIDAMWKRDKGQDQLGRDQPFATPAANVWLHRTAECMTRAGVFSFHLEDLSPQWFPPARRVAVRRAIIVVTSLVLGLSSGLFGGLIVGLIGGLFSFMLTGLVTSSAQRRTNVNGGLKRSAIYTLAMALPFLSLAVLTRFMPQPIAKLIAMTSFSSALFLALDKGGAFCIKTLTIRCLLARSQYIPWRYVTFLNFSVDRVFMIRQGGSFKFIHRMLQEHLAARPASTS